ncbi:rRNA maturation RNase YbeY [Christiangramia aquimixticola]|uniref:rRNA maturation RNase YbeY n=1 Tax=Christiangramia aquimixticola TaxID=1697558 RepID=UPI003AA8D7ED
MEKGEINFFSETGFELSNEKDYQNWLTAVIESEEKFQGDINYIFCDDEYLLDINQQYLDHDTYTDIISFDYTVGNVLQGDIYISIERVKENAGEYSVDFGTELRRVMAHGILHFCGYKDKSERDQLEMRRKEEEKIKLFHVEQS